MSFFVGPESEGLGFSTNISPIQTIHDALKRNGDSPAVIEGWSGRSASFQDLLKQTTMVSAGLRALGVTAGDYVLFCCEKSIVAQYLLLGTFFTGATAVLFPIPHADNVPEMVHGNMIKVVITDPAYLPTLSKSVAELKVQPLLIATTDPALKSLLKPAEDVEVFDLEDPTKHVPFIMYSSGTTGIPKAIQLPGTCLMNIERVPKRDFKICLMTSPFYWFSLPMLILLSLCKNFTILMSNSSDASFNLELVEKYKAEGLFVGSGSMTKYINEPTLPNYDLSSLKYVSVGGEAVLSCISRDFFSKVLREKVTMIILYGSTELGMMSSFCVKKLSECILGVCGKPSSGVEIKITDDTGSVLPIGSLGEIRVRSPTMTAGFWGRVDLDKEAIDQEGFFRTGDAGFFDQQGVLHHRGREMDLITYKGIKIASMDLEDVLMSHPEVFDVAVVGRTHPTDNEHLTAFVVRIPGGDVTEQQLLDLVNKDVADEIRLRGGLYFIKTMPRTIIGKIQRKLLKDLPLEKILNMY